MTTEGDFHAALDADPSDWQTRLVLADWLQERGDPRAEGYRALARTGRTFPVYDEGNGYHPIFKESVYRHSLRTHSLPDDWFALLEGGVQTQYGAPVQMEDDHPNWGVWFDWISRRAAEDAAALAFARLPAARRAELMAASPA